MAAAVESPATCCARGPEQGGGEWKIDDVRDPPAEGMRSAAAGAALAAALDKGGWHTVTRLGSDH